jgi:glutamate dehydrogenase
MSSQLSNLLIDVKGLISNGNVNYRDYSFKLVNIVPENYTYGLNAKEFYDDLVKLNELTSKNFNGRFFNRGNDLIMKIYLKNKEVKLSNIVRILDNLTFNVRDHSGFEIVDDSVKMSIHEFKASSALAVDLINNREASQSFFETFEKILNEEWNESPFNKFSLTVGLNFREIQLLTAFNNYYRQVAPKYDIETIIILTQKHVDVFQLFVKLFHLKFNPDMKAFIKLDDVKIVRNAINDALNKIDVLNNYKTLKDIYEILLAISRTNYYQNKSYISLKIRPAMLSYLTGTQPFAEIFVFSYEFEAVHLRESKVSRGGLRWSDRRDYRTEVLGLMRAQMKKNTIIIPQGAKGGFFINHPERCRADKNYVVKCYKTFLSGILDITDNLDAKNQIIRPPQVILPVDLEPHILKDEVQDPYVVVAADKGTGTFSDYANSVSAEYKFWLDDAYASGGSNGYDHKKLAITSRGAWVTVTKLFNEIGVDITEQDFTVIGIGDMFSDVFVS